MEANAGRCMTSDPFILSEGNLLAQRRDEGICSRCGDGRGAAGPQTSFFDAYCLG